MVSMLAGGGYRGGAGTGAGWLPGAGGGYQQRGGRVLQVLPPGLPAVLRQVSIYIYIFNNILIYSVPCTLCYVIAFRRGGKFLCAVCPREAPSNIPHLISFFREFCLPAVHFNC